MSESPPAPKRQRRTTYAEFVASHDLNYGISAPDQGGAEAPVQIVQPLESLVFDEIGVRLCEACAPFAALYTRADTERVAQRCECGSTRCLGCEERARPPVAAVQQANAILWRLPKLECVALKSYEERGAAMKAARATLVTALHAADEAAHAYANSIADVIVADAAAQVAVLVESTEVALRREQPPPSYETPPERIGGVISFTF